jgi:hypothetical protein
MSKVLIEIAPNVFINSILDIKHAYVHACGSLIIIIKDVMNPIQINNKEDVKVAVKRLREYALCIPAELKEEPAQTETKGNVIYDNYVPERSKTFFNGDIEEINPNGVRVTIQKSSSIEEWCWTAKVGDKKFTQVRESYNWGFAVRPSSSFAISILKEITGIEIKDHGQYAGYRLGKNQVEMEYVTDVGYDTKFETPKELADYIIKTVKAIKDKVKETENVQTNVFYI